MKKTVLYIVLLMLVTSAAGQDTLLKKLSMKDFVAIRIQNGLTPMGTNSLFLVREGFGYWKAPIFEMNNTEKSCFIPFSKLNYKKVWKIMEYVYANNLMEIGALDSLETPTNIHVHRETLPIIITLYSYCEQKHTVIHYSYKNEKIDMLIEMMNALIPLKDRNNFLIKGLYTTIM